MADIVPYLNSTDDDNTVADVVFLGYLKLYMREDTGAAQIAKV